MRISVLTIGAIASILSINSVFATTSTVTSKDYVDAADALKQNKIPATGTNAATPGTTVVTYTGTAGQIGERGIFNSKTDLRYTSEGYFVRQGNENKLITAADLPRPKEEYIQGLECADENCTLWNVSYRPVFIFDYCNSDSDCSCSGSAFCDTETHSCDCVPFM